MRTTFTTDQQQQLEQVFKITPYPGICLRESIASNVNLSESRVQVWFQNRRAKLRRKQARGAMKQLGGAAQICNVSSLQSTPDSKVDQSNDLWEDLMDQNTKDFEEGEVKERKVKNKKNKSSPYSLVMSSTSFPSSSSPSSISCSNDLVFIAMQETLRNDT